MRSRISPKLIFASCVRYFDRAYYGFWGEQNLIKTDNIRQNLTAVELKGGMGTYIVYRLYNINSVKNRIVYVFSFIKLSCTWRCGLSINFSDFFWSSSIFTSNDETRPDIHFIKSWKTSAVSTTVWMVETQLCKLRGTSDIYTNYRSPVFYVLSLWRI